MENKKVVITLGKDGSVKVEAIGFKGASCVKATSFLSSIFGNPKMKRKNSFFEEEETIINGLPSGYCG